MYLSPLMGKLNFPEYEFKVNRDSKGTQIFDIVRKKFFMVTPEEIVRQHAIHFLHFEKGYPLSLMAVEKEIKVNNMSKRFDLVCYDTYGQPRMICEFKQPEVPINQSVFMQVANYNIVMGAPLVYVTNGIDHYIAEIDFSDKSHKFLREIPNHQP